MLLKHIKKPLRKGKTILNLNGFFLRQMTQTTKYYFKSIKARFSKDREDCSKQIQQQALRRREQSLR